MKSIITLLVAFAFASPALSQTSTKAIETSGVNWRVTSFQDEKQKVDDLKSKIEALKQQQKDLATKLSEVSAKPQETTGEVTKAIKPTSGREFRKAFRQAIRKARADKKITAYQFRVLRTASFSNVFMEQTEDLLVIQMVYSGEDLKNVMKVNSDGSIDRTSIDWITLIPFIIDILKEIWEQLIELGIIKGARG